MKDHFPLPRDQARLKNDHQYLSFSSRSVAFRPPPAPSHCSWYSHVGTALEGAYPRISPTLLPRLVNPTFVCMCTLHANYRQALFLLAEASWFLSWCMAQQSERGPHFPLGQEPHCRAPPVQQATAALPAPEGERWFASNSSEVKTEKLLLPKWTAQEGDLQGYALQWKIQGTVEGVNSWELYLKEQTICFELLQMHFFLILHPFTEPLIWHFLNFPSTEKAEFSRKPERAQL